MKAGYDGPMVDWGFATGRTYLRVAGYAVAVEGEPLRDAELSQRARELHRSDVKRAPYLENFYDGHIWTGELIKWVAAQANPPGWLDRLLFRKRP